jgi:DNA-binding MarR family transcriptional regulator
MPYQFADIGYQEADMTRSVKKAKAAIGKPRLERIGLIKAVLQGYRIRLDEELHPFGITTSQLRMLWAVEANPTASGAEVARSCSVTPQTGQATLAAMEANGWIRRKARADGGRVLVSEVTASGRKVLARGKKVAEGVNGKMWEGMSERDLGVLDRVLVDAVGRLER